MEDRQEIGNPEKDAAKASPPDQWRIIPALHAVAAVGLAIIFIAVLSWSQLRHTPLGRPLWVCFDAYCHNIPARSLRLAGEPLPVCARCTGVIAGYLLGAVLALCGAEKLPVWRLPWAIALIGLMGLSWAGGQLGYLPEAWHSERVVAGALGGLGGYIFIARIVILTLRWWHRRQTTMAFQGRRESS